MDGKFNKLIGKRALIAGLVLGYNGLGLQAFDHPLGLEIPYLSEWTDRSIIDSRIAIGNNIARINGMAKLIENYILTNKNYNPNQRVIIGYSLPLIHFAASLNKTEALQKLLENNDTIVSIETSLGNTPMHMAAMNSPECLRLLIENGSLDINEHNHDGKTPLYIAMECGNTDSRNILVNSEGIKLNSRDNKEGKTMLHIAVEEGNKKVVKQIIDLFDPSDTNSLDSIKIDMKDNKKKTPADYIENIESETVKTIIQNCLAKAGAHYGDANKTPVPEI